jgi:hypothetical protein
VFTACLRHCAAGLPPTSMNNCEHSAWHNELDQTLKKPRLIGLLENKKTWNPLRLNRERFPHKQSKKNTKVRLTGS